MYKVYLWYMNENRGQGVMTTKKVETIESANEWIDKKIEPFIKDHGYHFFKKEELTDIMRIIFIKDIPLENDRFGVGHRFIWFDIRNKD